MRRPLWLVLCSLVLLSGALPAIADDGAAAPDRCYQLGVLLDPRQPADEADEELRRLRNAAEGGHVFAAYLLGTLHRLGPAHPAARVPVDAALARQWLREAALAGSLPALGGWVETELADGQPREALVLALVRFHLERLLPKSPIGYGRDYGGDATQVNRAFAALGEPRTEALEAELLASANAFLARHGATIEAGINEAKADARPDGCPAPYDARQWPLEYRAISAVLLESARPPGDPPEKALFYVMVAPDGRVARALVLDYSPDLEAVELLQQAAESMRFNKARGAPVREALMPLKLR
jgi:TPR repeat protein